MQVSTSSFTIVKYCSDLKQGSIVVNTDYQRSSEVWPPAAKSYLIDTILLGFPIPKLTLHQKTDLKSRKTISEIVDGQQRTHAINEFLNDGFRITGKSDYRGKRFSDLEEEVQQRFVEYSLTADVLVGAKEDEIRQLFRRINSYTVPLNREEQRHATHQGDFKWFMVTLTGKYSQVIKDIGVLRERQLSRMQDSKLFTEIIVAMLEGIGTYSKKRLDDIYEKNDETFANAVEIEKRFDNIFGNVLTWSDLHNTGIMKVENFYSLALAITHVMSPIKILTPVYKVTKKGIVKERSAVQLLSQLAEIIDGDVKVSNRFQEFYAATTEATNTEKNRTIRFCTFCDALVGK